MKTVRRWLALCLAVCLCFTSFSITEAAKKTVIVKTQKQLKKALKEGKASKIILKTTKNVKITIPKSAKAKNIILQVNAPNARIFNKSTFDKISLKGTKVNFTEQAADNKITVYAEQLSLSVAEDAFIEELKIVKAVKDSDIEVKGSVETITTRSDNANITVGEGAKVETIRTVKKDAKVNIVADGTVGTVTVAGKQTDIKISGNSEGIKVVVTSKENTLTASLPVKTEIKGTASTEIALKEGAENSEIKADNTASITVDNGTKEEIKVTQGNETTTVGSGEKEEVKGDQTPTTTTPTPTATPTPSTGGSTGGGGNSDSNTQTTEEKALQAIKAVKTEADVKAFLENAEYAKAAKLDLTKYSKMDAALQEGVRTTLLKEVSKLETIEAIAATWNETVNQIVENAPIRLGFGEAVEKYYQTFSETAKKEFEEMGKNINSDKRATLTILGEYENTDNFAIGANADVILLANSTFVNIEGTLTIEEGGTIQGRSVTSKIQNNSSDHIGSETNEKYKFDGNSEYIWESNAWKKVVVPEVSSIEISGEESITIPETDNVTKEYTAIVKDQDGKEMSDEEVTWSLKETGLAGVTIKDGTVTVTKDATAEKVTVVATSKTNTEINGTKEVTLSKAGDPSTPKVTSIQVSGADSITIPETENVTKEYTAIVKDQAGNEMTGEEVTWSLKETGLAGITIKDGTVTVTKDATAEKVTVVATSKTNTEISGTKEVTLSKAGDPSTPKVTSIQVNGAANITIPTGEAVTENYTAVVKDQAGNEMTGEEVTWSLKETGLAGVTIKDGTVTVTKDATAEKVTVIATSKTNTEISGTKEVTLSKAGDPSTPKVTSIQVNGAANITIPTGEAVTENYTAVVKDQAGNEMTGEEVTWSLKETGLAGVTIKDGTVTVTKDVTAEKVTVVATSKTNTEINGTKEVTLSKAGETPIPEVTSIEISGNTNITIPSGTAARAAELSTTNAVIATYTAVLKGASGEVVTASSDSITWSVVSTGTATTLNTTENTSITGVSIETKDNQGILTVTSEAQPGMIAITATFGELSDTMDVTLQEATGNKTNSPN